MGPNIEAEADEYYDWSPTEADYYEAAGRVQELSETVARLQADLDAARALAHSLQVEKAALIAEVEQARVSVDHAERSMVTLRAERDRLRERLATLEDYAETAEAELKSWRDDFYAAWSAQQRMADEQ